MAEFTPETADYDQMAQQRVREMRPDLDPASSKGAARSHRALVRQVSVAIECNDLRSQGVRNVPQRIAERRGMTVSTVRMLLHRASAERGFAVEAPRAAPSLAGALRIVADWHASSKDPDALIEALAAADYALPE